MATKDDRCQDWLMYLDAFWFLCCIAPLISLKHGHFVCSSSEQKPLYKHTIHIHSWTGRKGLRCMRAWLPAEEGFVLVCCGWYSHQRHCAKCYFTHFQHSWLSDKPLVIICKGTFFCASFWFELWPENTTFKKVLEGAPSPPRAGFVSYTHVLVIGNSMKKHNMANEARVGHITA